MVIMSPFDSEEVGLSYPTQKADIVTVSRPVEKKVKEKISGPVKREEVFWIDEVGEYEVGGVEVIAIDSFSDKTKGSERGKNLIMVARIEGVVICHLGNLSHDLTEKQIEGIGPIDVLMVPVGAMGTIGLSEAGGLVSGMSPSYVIPMSYKVKGMKSEFEGMLGVEEFLSKNNLEASVKDVDKIRVDRNSLPENTEIVVMDGHI